LERKKNKKKKKKKKKKKTLNMVPVCRSSVTLKMAPPSSGAAL